MLRVITLPKSEGVKRALHGGYDAAPCPYCHHYCLCRSPTCAGMRALITSDKRELDDHRARSIVRVA